MMANKVKERDFTAADLGDISSDSEVDDAEPSDNESSTDKSGGGFQSMGLILRAPSNLGKPENRDLDGYASENELDMRRLVAEQNKKKKKSGGFQSMGLGQAVFRGVMKKGYKVPTPIQRKAIPVIMEGRDVVAMARTGSGKTAAFLIPMLDKLQARVPSGGARALILSPTRELALQTLKFTKEIGKFTGLKAAVIVGGDDMDNQFAALHENPDIILATPGRLMHVCVEMGLQLNSVKYVVFDEADRLFEMGFKEQLHDILRRLSSDDRQTLLFSATLPKMLVDFAKAGLTDPYLIRLDVESKLSDMLEMEFFEVRSEDKTALLLHILKNMVSPDELTVVFAATKHHVELLHELLTRAGVDNTYLYSSLDATARKINAAKFCRRITRTLIVTDVAARGIDIPLLDNVVNYHFPAKGKLFVHRVGRVARAGRSGKAYSLVCADEVPFLLDLHLFLGRPLENFGSVTQPILEPEKDIVRRIMNESTELQSIEGAAWNGMRKYIASRPKPSSESVRRSKLLRRSVESGEGTLVAPPHPLLTVVETDETEKARLDMLAQVKAYRPKATIFEIAASKKITEIAESKPFEMMQEKRKRDEVLIANHVDKWKKNAGQVAEEFFAKKRKEPEGEQAEEDDIVKTFTDIFVAKKSTQFFREPFSKKHKGRRAAVDEDHFVPFAPADAYTERGLSVDAAAGSSFEKEAMGAILDFTADDAEGLRAQKNSKKWDMKKKKFVGASGNEGKDKKVKTEDGRWVRASYKSGRYEEWKKRNRMQAEQMKWEEADGSDDEAVPSKKSNKKPDGKKRGIQVLGTSGGYGRGRGGGGGKFSRGGSFRGRGELRTGEQVLKDRKMKKKKELAMQRRKFKGGRGARGGGTRGGRGARGRR